jgi:TonB family protein
MSDGHLRPGKIPPLSWALLALMAVLIGVAVYIVQGVLSGDSPRKKSSTIMVTLLKPPPPPQVKEKPPEPIKEIEKKEEVFTQPQQDVPEPAGSEDDTPAGDRLGVDAEGSAGGDAFGLVGKKGGKSILEGGSGSGLGRLSLLTRFSSYTRIVEAEIRKKVLKRLDEEGGIPKGKLQAVARVIVDAKGVVVNYKIIGSSGDHKMDKAINQALDYAKLSEPPPDGMPRTMVIRITSQG